MKIGCDVDGVLADFPTAYEALTRQVTGRDLFPPIGPDGPVVWDWPQHYGYTADEMHQVWAAIKADPEFWLSLEPLAGFDVLLNQWESLNDNHEIYFITDRPGILTRKQTEDWFFDWSGGEIHSPTVLVSGAKGAVCAALRLDAYIDDNIDNCITTINLSATTETYLLDRAYNRVERRGVVLPHRITGIERMFLDLGL